MNGKVQSEQVVSCHAQSETGRLMFFVTSGHCLRKFERVFIYQSVHEEPSLLL